MIDADLRQDLASRMEEGMDVAEAHRSKAVTSMKVIGKVTDVKDITHDQHLYGYDGGYFG